MTIGRRSFLASTSTGILLFGCSTTSHPAAKHADEDHAEHEEEEITPVEDLMREHGVLHRVMYLYDEASTRLEAGHEIELDALARCASMVRRVIEDYHERLEEDFLFPRYEQARTLADLTAVLRRQHQSGRVLTDRVLAMTKAGGADRTSLATVLRSFNHMYRAHAAREDTVLFPALRELVGKAGYAELGEQFEAKETQMLGAHGFERAVEEISGLEKIFGVDDLAKLTA